MLMHCEKNLEESMFFDDCGKCQYCCENKARFKDNLICPYCAYDFGVDHELVVNDGDCNDYECPECDEKFDYTCSHHIYFTAYQINNTEQK